MATNYPDRLSPETIISSQSRNYRIGHTLGAGGFGITYMASPQVTVGNVTARINFAIKEYFRNSLCGRDASTSEITYSDPVKEDNDNYDVWTFTLGLCSAAAHSEMDTNRARCVYPLEDYN